MVQWCRVTLCQLYSQFSNTFDSLDRTKKKHTYTQNVRREPRAELWFIDLLGSATDLP